MKRKRKEDTKIHKRLKRLKRRKIAIKGSTNPDSDPVAQVCNVQEVVVRTEKKTRKRRVVKRKSKSVVTPGIDKIFGASGMTYLKSMIRFINECQIEFEYKDYKFSVYFRDLCVYDYEIETMKKYMIRREVIKEPSEYAKLCAAINFPRCSDLNETVIMLTIDKSYKNTIIDNEDLLSQFTKESATAMEESSKYFSDSKRTAAGRIMAIGKFNSHIREFIAQQNDWKLSHNIVEWIFNCGLNNTTQVVISKLRKLLEYIQKYEKKHQLSRTHRIMYCLNIIATIVCKMSIVYGGKRENLFFRLANDQGFVEKKILKYLVIDKNMSDKNMFSKTLDLSIKENTILIKSDKKSEIDTYIFQPKYEIILFNRWSVRYKNLNGSVPSDGVYESFKKYVESINVGENIKMTTYICNCRKGIRQKIRENMVFLKRDGKRRRLYFDKSVSYSDGFYKIE